MRVWRQDGAEAWVLVHGEVQSQAEADFAERMYIYNYRLFDRYRRRVVSLAVLGDERAGWRPERFGYELWGCEVGLRFPTVKLLDYRARWTELEASRNPFAVVVADTSIRGAPEGVGDARGCGGAQGGEVAVVAPAIRAGVCAGGHPEPVPVH